ncbi:MAG TPA: nucleoside hydrolase [Anaerolineales bacterium]|nr:nucleoside hydrolase [Anaerolineales bacterium]
MKQDAIMERQNMLKKIAGLTLPEGQNTSSNGTAAELLSSVLKSAPEKITLLTLGPLANLAEAVQNDPSLAGYVEMIYIMGGAGPNIITRC